ncbi:MAG: HEAT repeat domain-containing protein [Thermoguttaceae bacterium]|jgi:hypothetical protein
MTRRAIGILAVLLLLTILRPAAAEVFMLSHGGRIEGELVNPDEKPRQTYVIKPTAGGQVTLSADQVKEVLSVRPDVAEYEKVRPDYPDTAEGQWDLAQWCRDHKLPAQRKIHLQRVIELDPEHVEARRLLGYNKIEGHWITQDEWMTKQGYVKYKNQWKLPQEVELLVDKRKQELAENEWFQKIKRWRGWLGTERDKQARQNFAAIADPSAVKALTDKLGLSKTDKRGLDPSQEARLIYIEALGRIHTPEAGSVLAVVSIEDEEREVRLSAVEQLDSLKSPGIIQYYIGKHGLRNENNVIVKRAAIALGRLKDPSSIGPLIDALITQHKQQVGSGNPGQMSMAFPTGGTKGGIGMGMGGNGPKIILLHVQNQSVLDALVAITGQNFGFDQRAWKTWYAAQNKAPPVDARRN